MIKTKFKNQKLTTSEACTYWKIKPDLFCYQKKWKIKNVMNLDIKYKDILDESLSRNRNAINFVKKSMGN